MYLTTHSTHFIYGYMASDILQRSIHIVREEPLAVTTWAVIYRISEGFFLNAPSHKQDNTYCHNSRGALVGLVLNDPHSGYLRYFYLRVKVV